jgi:hypothetical protein
MSDWTKFRDALGRLSVRHRPRLEQWQRILGPVFAGIASEEIIFRAIELAFATSQSWCAGGKVNEARAREELRMILITIRYRNEGEGVQKVIETERCPFAQVNRLAATLYGEHRADWADSMPADMKQRMMEKTLARAEVSRRKARLAQILGTL